VLIAVGWFFLILLIGPRGPGEMSWAVGSPFFGAGELTFEIESNERFESLAGAAVWIVVYSGAAALLFFTALYTFDRRLSRMRAGSGPAPSRQRRIRSHLQPVPPQLN
jgi:hypothetical protein